MRYSTLAAVTVVALSLVASILTGCTRSAESPSLDAEALLRENVALHHERSQLEERIDERDAKLKSVTRLVHKMLDDVQGIAARDGLFRGPSTHARVQLTDGFPYTERSLRVTERQFVQSLAVIESHLRDSENQIERVRNGERESTQTVTEAVAPLRTALQQMKETLDARQSVVEAKRDRLDSLRSVTQRLEETLSDLYDANAALHAKVKGEQTSYVVIGTSEELEAADLIHKRFLRTTQLKPVKPDAFTTIQATASTIPLPEGTEATILSPHREMPHLFSVENDTLVIHDPETFWAWSRFLIVEVEG